MNGMNNSNHRSFVRSFYQILYPSGPGTPVVYVFSTQGTPVRYILLDDCRWRHEDSRQRMWPNCRYAGGFVVSDSEYERLLAYVKEGVVSASVDRVGEALMRPLG